MMEKKIGVLVVDDSAFMRKALTRMLSSDPMIRVVDTADNGKDAFEKVKALRPDVVTLDVVMPGMDGLTALSLMMEECPVPVLMLSSTTGRGEETTFRALELGAVDFIDKTSAKSTMDILSITEELTGKVRALAGVDVNKLVNADKAEVSLGPRREAPAATDKDTGVLAIGASTGGPLVLQKILGELPADLPAAVLVVQHMPKGFTKSLAERLNRLSALYVTEAVDNEPLIPGKCLIAPSGMHMTVEKSGQGLVARLSKEPAGLMHIPSVDVLMNSVAKTACKNTLGVILTGMGSDGAKGMKALHDSGVATIAQDEDTCVVYGMPKAAVMLGGIDRSLSLARIPRAIVDVLARGGRHFSMNT